MTQEKTQLITIYFRPYNSLGADTLESLALLERSHALSQMRHSESRRAKTAADWIPPSAPDRLAGDDIPLAARIVAVADPFDAMTTVRPYRAARTPEQAIEEIEAEAGRQFDPEIAAIAREVLGDTARALAS